MRDAFQAIFPARSPRRGNSTLLAAAPAPTDATTHRILACFLPSSFAAFYTDENRVFPEEELVLTRRSFMLRDPDYGVAYEGFPMHLVREGSVVEVRDAVLEASAETAAMEARAIQAELAVGPEDYFVINSTTGFNRDASELSESSDDGGDRVEEIDEALQKRAIDWAKKMLDYGQENLTVKEKVWRFLDDPSSGVWARAFTCGMLALIVFSTFTFCIETLPQYYQNVTDYSDKFFIMEAVCIACFTAEFIARVSTTPDLKNYFFDSMNLVDVVAILPFYLELILADITVPGLSVFRVVRLVRVFRLFKMSRGSITVFVDTMVRSSKPLYMLVFFTSIATVIFSSLIYYVERGQWNDELEMWMRPYLHYCPVKAGADVGPAVKDPSNWTLDSGLKEPCKWVDPATYDAASVNYPSEALFTCPYTYERSSDCVKVYEQSPYDSIPTSFWWCLVTMTTVGYGDVVPTQPLGKVLGGLVMIFGIIVIALPITVIGSNFATIYEKMVLHEGEPEVEAGEDEDDEDDEDDDNAESEEDGDEAKGRA